MGAVRWSFGSIFTLIGCINPAQGCSAAVGVLEVDQPGPRPTIRTERDQARGDREVEAPGSGAPRVEHQRVLDPFDDRAMRMPVDDDRGARVGVHQVGHLG